MGKDQRGNDDDTVVLAKMLEYRWQIMNPEKGLGFPGGSDGKVPACNVGDLGQEDPLEDDMEIHSSIPAWRIPMDRGAWWAKVMPGVTESWTQLNN